MPVLGLTLTFAAFDWIMSLEPAWFSSMFGIYYFAGGFVAAIALLVLLARAGERSGWLAGYLQPSHYYALGRMLLAFTIFWAYIAYFQFFLIYIADRPDEVRYFVRRGTGSWFGFAIVLAVAHFALPFLLLLRRGLKLQRRSTRGRSCLAAARALPRRLLPGDAGAARRRGEAALARPRRAGRRVRRRLRRRDAALCAVTRSCRKTTPSSGSASQYRSE